MVFLARFRQSEADLRQRLMRPLAQLVAAVVLLIGLLLPVAPVLALNAAGFPEQPPADHVLDEAHLLSRAANSDVSRALDAVAQQGVNATWLSLPRLDYGLSLQQLGEQVLERWHSGDQPDLLLLIDGQTSATAIVASADLQDRLSPDLLRSTARTTMAQPLRDGGRVRQASLDAIERLSTVLAGEPDPGEPVISTSTVATARVPSRQETESSNAFTWVVVLLVVGSVVPMLTWWVFSR